MLIGFISIYIADKNSNHQHQKPFKAKFSRNYMKAGRKATGGRYPNPKKKKKNERNRQARVVKIGERKTKTLRTKGGNKKLIAHALNKANITDDKKTKVVEIKTVLETPSNTFLARQNILVKGAIIETELGKAKITNRPNQDGQVQAILIKE